MADQRRSTLVEVAKRAGFSTKTASLALQHGKGSPEVVSRLKKAAEDLRYTVRRRRAGQDILIVTPLDTNPEYYSDLVMQTRANLRAQGYYVLHQNTRGAAELELLALARGLQDRVAGVILFSPRALAEEARMLARRRIPTVVVGAPPNQIPSWMGRVHIRDYEGTFDAVEYLAGEMRHTKIAYLGGNPAAFSEIERRRGFFDAMKGGDLIIRPRYIVGLREGATAGFLEGRLACESLIGVDDSPTAAVCYNDRMAMGCLLAAYKQGLVVPRDLSVVGHNGLEFTEYTTPPLTTVLAPRNEIGTHAAEAVVDLIGGEKPSDVQIEVRLVKRESVTSPAG